MKQDIHTYTRTHHCYVPDYTYLTHTQKECEITHTALMLVDHTHIAQVLERVRGEREIIIFVCCGTLLVIACVGFRFGRFVPFHQQICWWFVYGCPITNKHHKNTNIIISLSSLILSMLCAVCV